MGYKVNEPLLLDVLSAKRNRPQKPIKRVWGTSHTLKPKEDLTQDQWFEFLHTRKKV